MVYGRYNELGFIGVKLYQRSHHWGPPSCWKLLVWPPWAMCEMLSKEARHSSNFIECVLGLFKSEWHESFRSLLLCSCMNKFDVDIEEQIVQIHRDFCESFPKKRQEMLPSTIRPMFGIRLGIRLSHLDAAHLQDHCRPLSQVMAFHGPKAVPPIPYGTCYPGQVWHGGSSTPLSIATRWCHPGFFSWAYSPI